MPRTFAAPLISLLAALLILNACSTGKSSSPKTGRYVVSVPKAAFYKYGPAQNFGPDLQLPQGQKITALDHGFGFSHVITDDGTTGYVANEDIKPAPPEPAAAASQNPLPSSPSRGGRSNHSNSIEPPPKTPGLDLNDVPLPLPTQEITPPPSGLKLN